MVLAGSAQVAAAPSAGVASMLTSAARASWRGNVAAGAVLAALSAFLVLGAFDTLIDSPRFLMLLLLLCWLALLPGYKKLALDSAVGRKI